MTSRGALPSQPDLFESDSTRTLDDIQEYLNDGSHFPVEVAVTRNRISMITIEFIPDGTARVRMHEAFLVAPWEVIVSLRRYLRTHRRKEWAVVQSFARTIVTDGGQGRRVRTRTAGQVYDLKAVFAEVNRDFFNGRIKCRITWGRMATRRRRRKRSSICFGSWNAATGIIRIHPALDDKRVPPEFLRYIVFHEALHAFFSSKSVNSRDSSHGPDFRALERAFPRLDGMKAMSQKMLKLLSR